MPTPNQSPAPRYTLGEAKEHGTYNANMLFCDGEPVAQMSGVPINTTAEEMEAGIGKRWEPIWKRAKAICDALNALPAAAEALELARHAFEEEATHSKEAGLDDDADAWVELGAAMTNALRALKPE